MNPSQNRHLPGRIRRALLIDDDKFMLTVVGDLLRDLGVAEVTTATNGAAGLDAFDRLPTRPELVVCDLAMPVSDGFEFMEQLGTKGYTGGVVLCSGMNDRTMNSAALMARFHRLQFLGTIKKPVERAELGAALAKLA
jgi:CheY-like chemotaxis protein